MRISCRLFLLPVLLILIPSLTQSQDLLQGNWRDHLSYRSCHRIAEVGDWVYCSSETGLISFHKESYELRKHSKATGLSDVQISTIAYSGESGQLIVGYSNGNIDLITEGQTPLNISDIKRRIMTADKNIYQIHVIGNTAYLACGFGIVVLNLVKQEIKETYILGESGAFIRVNDITILDDYLFAATESGVFSADLNSSNLLDYNYWTLLDFLPQFNKEYHSIEAHNNKVFAVYADEISQEDQIVTFTPEATSYQAWDKEYDHPVSDISSASGFLTLGSLSRALIYNQNELLIDEFVSYNTTHVCVTSDEMVFIASSYSGFTWRISSESTKYLSINGPRFSQVSKVTSFEDRIWVTSGGPSRLYKHGAVYYLNSSGEWKSYTGNQIVTENPLGNTYKVAIDPADPEHVYVASYGYGIFEIREEEVINIFELNNTEHFSGIPDVVGIRAAGIQFDENRNLHFILNLVSSPLFIIDAEGNWQRPVISNSLFNQETIIYSDLLITSSGQIWILSRNSKAVILEDEGDGYYRSKIITIKNQFDNVFSRSFCLTEDKEGNIWIGTNNGPVIYYSPWNIFDAGEVSGYQVPIPRNDGTNIVDPLLFSESIFDIVVDGGNRKWLATDQSGIFLISEDGKKTLANFTEENSALLSNGVTGIGINEKTGEVFFATDLGLMSYGGIATEGALEYSDVYVYPNPIRPGYAGPITITGLVVNSVVKITDVSGNLVWETESLGGQAVWDGRNFSGRRVASGVYLIMLATEDGQQSHITKLLFLH